MTNLRIFYERIIEFDKYIEIRIVDNNTKKMFSKYVCNYKELIHIAKQFRMNKYNMYIGTNTRPDQGRKDIDIPVRRCFYFDIEADTKSNNKPELSNMAYYNKLKLTVEYIKRYMLSTYNMASCALIESGRGMHLMYKINPIDSAKYKEHFKSWYKQIQDKLDVQRPFKDIKFSDSVFNVGRIQGMPGTYNTKYAELPTRSILELNETNVYDIISYLESQKVYKRKQMLNNIEVPKGSIYNTKEFLLLKDHDDLPEGERHTTLFFALKMLARDMQVDEEEIQGVIENLGYEGEDMIYPDDTYIYTTGMLNNWCFRNAKWCNAHNYKLPYKLKQIDCCKAEACNDMIEYEGKPIKDLNDMLVFIREFNSSTSEHYGNFRSFYVTKLITLLKKHMDKDLWLFCVSNDVIRQYKFIM